MISKQLSVGAISLSNVIPLIDGNFQLSDDPILLSSDLSNIDMSQLSNLSGVARVYVGKNIDEYFEDPKKAKLSNDTLWFDTTESVSSQVYDIRRMDSLQEQIYRLGLQVRDVVKVVENGVIPGDAYTNTKEEMIEIADFIEPPQDSIDSTLSLLGMSIYGNYWCKNNEIYYIMFNPSGYIPKNTDKYVWEIKDHDDTSISQKTFENYVSTDNKYYSLQVKLNDKILSSTMQVQMKASIYLSGTTPIYTEDQETINSVIAVLSANNNCNMEFLISSDISDDILNESIKSEYFEIEFKQKESDHVTPIMSIAGSDYIDINNSELYSCKIDETVKKFALNTNTHWFFLSSFYIDIGEGEKQLSTIKTDKLIKIINKSTTDSTLTGSVTYSILHGYGSPVSQVSTDVYNCDLTSIKDLSVELYVESNYDNSLSAVKTILGVGGKVPNTENTEPTTKAVCAKVDKKSNLIEKSSTLYAGEMVFFSDTNQFAIWDGTQFRVLNSSESSGLSKEEIQDIGLDYLDFTTQNNNTIKNKFNIDSNGQSIIIQHNTSEAAQKIEPTNYDTVNNVWVNGKLQIGKIYCGGKKMTRTDFCPTTYENIKKSSSKISHNFIEIVNASDSDINLDKIYLLYHTNDADFAPDSTEAKNTQGWEFIKLSGIIKAGGTYLIRGACCNPTNSATMKIDHCDLEWRKRTSDDNDIISNNYKVHTRSGDLIEFSPHTGSFFLCAALDNNDGQNFGNNILNVLNGIYTPENLQPNISENNKEKCGYIDLVGIVQVGYENTTSPEWCRVNPYSTTKSFDNLLFYKWFYLDPSSQGNKAFAKRTNADQVTCVDLTRYPEIYNSINKRDKYYYSDIYKKVFKPGTSLDNNGIFSTKTHFRSDKPNMVNITFGIQATQSDSKLASRCFNWISEGYYDEYIKYRKVNSDGTYSSWSKEYYSITPITDNTIDGALIKGDNYDFHEFYDRNTWVASDGTEVTTHKVILRNKFEAGKYEYQIGRKNDSLYLSEIKEFTVHTDSDINNGFSFIQTSDQQGFNFIEYQAWKAACKGINDFEKNFNFTINTGDIAQSGNRVSEWLDYYDGRQYFDNKEEMFTIGNNDLCGKDEAFLGDGNDKSSKFNLINITHYYTFELDPDNEYYSIYEDSTHPIKKYPLYSLYSFDYGMWHFISLVSEIREQYAKTYDEFGSESAAFAKQLNADVENWLIRDLTKYKQNHNNISTCEKCIIYMHEMPFTMVTPEFFDMKDESSKKNGRSTSKTGCKLNLQNKKGNYRISRIFKKEGIRLVFGGHKHTFTLSHPLYDAGDILTVDNNIPLSTSGAEDSFISCTVDVIKSRKPVVEVPINGVKRLITAKFNEISNSLAYSNLSADIDSLINRELEKTKFNQKLNNVIYTLHLSSCYALDTLNTYNTDLSDWVRFDYVNEISAPTLVMTQATGFKVISNKELPSPLEDSVSGKNICRRIPWLLSYCAAIRATFKDSTWTCTQRAVQKRPTYVRYDLNNNGISVSIKQIDGILDLELYKDTKNQVQDGSKQFTLDLQTTQLSVLPVTFGAFGREHPGKFDPIQEFDEYKSQPTILSDYMIIYQDYISADTYIIKL